MIIYNIHKYPEMNNIYIYIYTSGSSDKIQYPMTNNETCFL